jgi:hypothetical protein
MAASDPNTRIDLSLDAQVMNRLERYARQHGITPEAVLLQSVIAFLDDRLTPATRPADNRKRGRRTGG